MIKTSIFFLTIFFVTGKLFSQNVFPSTGNVGIGTTTPVFKLHVSNGTVYVDNGANNGFRAGAYLNMGNMSYGNSPFISFNATLTTSNISTNQNLFTPAYSQGSGLILRGDAGGSALHFLQKNYAGNSGETDINSFTEVLTLDQAGRLGIGTSPQGKLDVAYTGGTSNFGSIAGGNNFLWTRSSGGNVGLYAGGYTGLMSSGDINFMPNQTYGSENYNTTAIIKANGNVGIGTVYPGTLLDVYSGSNDPTLRVMSGQAGAWLTAQSTTGFYAGVKLIGNNGTQNWSAGMTQGNSNYSIAGSTDGSTNRFFNITYNGNIGIGTANPQSKFDVTLDNMTESNLMNANNVNDVVIMRAPFGSNSSTVSNKAAKWGMRFVGRTDGVLNSQKSAAIYASSEDNLGYNRIVGLSFCTSDFDQNLLERMIISGTGNVAIGNKNPLNYKLAVEGTIGARKVKVTQESWADYVFSHNYQLRPLQDLETYIKHNQHLPDVPSAKDVAKDGIDLGDNQVLLLKKLEELTLYLIDQHKEINALKAEITAIKKLHQLKHKN